MSTAATAARNTIYNLTSLVLQKLIYLFALTFITRNLGVEEYGKLEFCFQYVFFFYVLMDFGLTVYTIREVAQNREKAGHFLGVNLFLRGLLSGISLILLSGMAVLLPRLETGQRICIVLIGVVYAFTSMSNAFSSLFRAYERMLVPAVLDIANTLIYFGLVVFFVKSGYGYQGVAFASVIGILCYTVGMALSARILTRPKWDFGKDLAFKILKESVPFLVSSILLVILFRIAVVMLKYLAPENGQSADMAVGLYGLPFKFLDFLLFIPASFMGAVYPIMSRMFGDSEDRVERVTVLSFRAMLIVSVPITVGAYLTADRIIPIFGEGFSESIRVLQILIFFVPLSFINSVFHHLLLSIGQQRAIATFFGLAALTNVVVNIFVIPRWSYVGAAFTTLATEVVIFVPFYLLTRKHLKPMPWLSSSWRPLVSAAGMGLAVYYMGGANVYLVSAVGIVIYSLSLLMLREFRTEDRNLVREIVRSLK